MSPHTPGQWTVMTLPARDGGGCRVIVREPASPLQPTVLATVSTARGAWRDNARLIAAAPEMLEALQGMLAARGAWRCDEAGPCGECPLCLAWDRARAAIAKATGEPTHA